MSHDSKPAPRPRSPRWTRYSTRAQVSKFFRYTAIMGLFFGIAAVILAALHPALSGPLHPGLADAKSVADLNFVITETLMLAFVPLADFGFGFEDWMATEQGCRRFTAYASALSRFTVVWTVVMLLFCTGGDPLFIAISASEGIMAKVVAAVLCRRAHEAVDVWNRSEGVPAETLA